MPYADPERRREAQRNAQRRTRARRAGQQGDRQPVNPGSEGLSAQALGHLLWEELEVVRRVQDPGGLERARCIAQLVTVALRVLEVGDLERRLEALEVGDTTTAGELLSWRGGGG